MPEDKAQEDMTPEEIAERTRKKLEDDEKEHQKVRDQLDADNKKVADEEKAKREKAEAKAKKEEKEKEKDKPAASHAAANHKTHR
jgi:hypothetical protein